MRSQENFSMGVTVLATLSLLLACSPNANIAAREIVTKKTIDKWMVELSNWDRWGSKDELGALNLITPEKRVYAANLVERGISVSLARNVETKKAADNPNPFIFEMTATGVDATDELPWAVDRHSVLYHGYAHTHVDSLSHMFYKGKMFNGHSKNDVTEKGSQYYGVQNMKQGVFTRGVLMDIAKLKGLPYLEPGTAIHPEDLDAWEKQAGLKVSSGDVVFIRTGRWKRRDEQGIWPTSDRSAGLFASCAKWLKERDVAMLGSDAASDVHPSQVDGVSHPIHQLVLIAMGMPIFDNCDLEALAEESTRQGLWEFLLTTAPIPVTGGTGSPLNPIATF